MGVTIRMNKKQDIKNVPDGSNDLFVLRGFLDDHLRPCCTWLKRDCRWQMFCGKLSVDVLVWQGSAIHTIVERPIAVFCKPEMREHYFHPVGSEFSTYHKLTILDGEE